MILEKDQEIANKETDARSKELAVTERDRQINELQMHLKYHDSTNQMNEELKKEVEQAQKQRVQLQSDFNQALHNHEQKLDQEFQARTDLIAENNALQAQMQAMQK